MFYSHTILAKKSPLGTVWIAAHLERKIKKPQIDGIDIPSYADCIIYPEAPIALRLSGHLLLGLVRIYSWKVNYLFQDCNRMLSTIRTAFASVQVDLPVDADRAPFEAITLPETFNLDDINLDDAIRQMDSPDNHRKSLDQITLPEGGEYVTIHLDEDARVEPSPPGRSRDSYSGPEPFEQETLPRYDGDFVPSERIAVDPPVGSSAPVPDTDEQHGTPEIMREATMEHLPDFDNIIDGHDDMDQDPSPFVPKVTTPLTPLSMDQPSPGRGSLPGTSVPNVPRSTSDDPLGASSRSEGFRVPEFILASSPPQAPDIILAPSPPQAQQHKRKRGPEIQENKRKRKPKFDKEIVFSNDYMRRQIEGEDLGDQVRGRRNGPHTAVDTWKFNRFGQKGHLFHEPLVHGMCTDLHELYERKFPRVRDSDVESSSGGRVSGVANVGRAGETTPEYQSPKSPGNTNAQPTCQPTPKSPENADAQPASHLTPKSPGNADARDPYEDMTPELPRFAPPSALSPIREQEDTPFITPGGTSQPGFGGTGDTEIPPTNASYESSGQKTLGSDPNASPFPFDDDFDEDLPEIPGIRSTPSMIPSAGTSATGLGSMSARTRAVAQYFKDQTLSATSSDQTGRFSLNKILERRARKQAARMFFETLALKSYDYIDVQQEEAYGDIEVSVRPSLAEGKL